MTLDWSLDHSLSLPVAERLFQVTSYNRSYVPRSDGPKVTVRGFAQETGGPLGKYAKSLLRTCAESTPSYGLRRCLARTASAPGTEAFLSASPCSTRTAMPWRRAISSALLHLLVLLSHPPLPPRQCHRRRQEPRKRCQCVSHTE